MTAPQTPLEITSTDHSADATFALAVWVQGSPISAENDPNTSAPAANRIVRCTAKRSALMTMGGPAIMQVVTGFTANASAPVVVTQLWFFDDTIGLWLKYGTQNTTTLTNATSSNLIIQVVRNLAGAKLFMQIVSATANGGALPTALGYDVV